MKAIKNFLRLVCVGLLSCGGARTPVDLTITVAGDEMKYDRSELRVKANSHVKLTLINKATMSTMHHNIIIYDFQGMNRSKALDQIGELAFKAGEASNYVPQVPGILAASPMSLPGQTVTVEFDAPPPGEYLFLCTFQPAHYKTMNGAFIVEP